jgi:hypothetical protein
MSDPVIMAIIGAVTTVINSLIARANHADTIQRTDVVRDKIDAVDQKVESTHVAINGRMTELLSATNAQGRQEQRAETRQDAKDDDQAHKSR